MPRPTKTLANKDYGTYRLGAAFTRLNGVEQATSNEATTNNRHVTYTVTCKSCNNVTKKLKASLYAGFKCGCGAIHAGPTKEPYSLKPEVTVFLAGEALVMIPLARADAEVLFRLNLDYSTYYAAWKQHGSVIWVTDTESTSAGQRVTVFEKKDGTAILAETVPMPTINGIPAYVNENVDAETRAAYEAELAQPIAYPKPSGQPLGEVFTTAVTRAALAKHANYFDNLNALADAIGLRPPAPNQRSGWLASASTRNLILAKERHGGNVNLPPIYQDASARFESVATYPVNDIEEVWYYLYEYAPSSPDDIPDF